MNIHKGKGLNTLARTLHTIPFLYGSGRFFQPTLDGHYLIVHIFSLKTQTVQKYFFLFSSQTFALVRQDRSYNFKKSWRYWRANPGSDKLFVFMEPLIHLYMGKNSKFQLKF